MKILSTFKAFGLVAVLATASSAVVLDDMSSGNGTSSDGMGLWTPDSDQGSGGNSDVLIGGLSAIGEEIANCPTGDADDDGLSDCYWGWNVDQGYEGGSLNSTIKVTAAVPSSLGEDSWSWASAGWFYIFNGTSFENAAEMGFSGQETLTLSASFPIGKKLRVQVKQTNLGDLDTPARMEISGTGSMKDYSIPLSGLVVPDWDVASSGKRDMSKVVAIGFLYTVGGTATGADLPDGAAGEYPMSIAKLSCEGCSAGTALVNAAAGSVLNFEVSSSAIDFSQVSEQTSVELFNLSGELVSSESFSSDAAVSITNLSNGTYIARVNEGSSVSSFRFLVNK
jgi:hypothetical protein